METKGKIAVVTGAVIFVTVITLAIHLLREAEEYFAYFDFDPWQ